MRTISRTDNEKQVKITTQGQRKAGQQGQEVKLETRQGKTKTGSNRTETDLRGNYDQLPIIIVKCSL